MLGGTAQGTVASVLMFLFPPSAFLCGTPDPGFLDMSRSLAGVESGPRGRCWSCPSTWTPGLGAHVWTGDSHAVPVAPAGGLLI